MVVDNPSVGEAIFLGGNVVCGEYPYKTGKWMFRLEKNTGRKNRRYQSTLFFQRFREVENGTKKICVEHRFYGRKHNE